MAMNLGVAGLRLRTCREARGWTAAQAVEHVFHALDSEALRGGPNPGRAAVEDLNMEADILAFEGGDLTALSVGDLQILAAHLGKDLDYIFGAGDEDQVDEPRRLTINVEGYETTRAQNWIAEQAAELLVTRVMKDITEGWHGKVGKRIGELVTEQIERRVPAMVEEAIVKGWTEADRYGDRTKVHTVTSRLREMLEKETGGYNQPKRTWVESLAHAYIEGAVQKELAAEFEAAKKRFRGAVDKLLEARVLEALRVTTMADALRGG